MTISRISGGTLFNKKKTPKRGIILLTAEGEKVVSPGSEIEFGGSHE